MPDIGGSVSALNAFDGTPSIRSMRIGGSWKDNASTYPAIDSAISYRVFAPVGAMTAQARSTASSITKSIASTRSYPDVTIRSERNSVRSSTTGLASQTLTKRAEGLVP